MQLSLLMVLLGVGLLAHALQTRNRLEKELTDTRNRTLVLRANNTLKLAQEPSLQAALARHAALREVGLFLPEDQPALTHRLLSNARSLRLDPPSSAFARQRLLHAVGNPAVFQIQASEMTMTLNVLHEGDLLQILEDLRDQSQSLLRPARCVLKSPEETAGMQRMHAECAVDWITLAGAA
ncbi:MAG: hypothetical protein CGU28_13610 [Candidatus Dactylopiibacterium carminicum]|uniref:General secretion pathway protein GspM n=2 Tax=Candidatus Dactylopiibacterium carminicum TaxID=857335 RepID=A0A272ERF6_9RHOO|nr:hypothetical protein BGI27_11300 [Candidatus Dactylopiibacterium carminicum]PAS92693.1 MAG: hypothetical protein CGU29_10675 [Candidatus Dactylopiibacterium carminicum]PAS94736.1 MAG: hypothetical protein CGU28_13610 [Candidatus Dactylopiibacterium carminicum]PAS98801.1 MAG: hypothetical protein BSR46_11315 [Candidatus Dactylopiibacterium carminicum]